MKKQNSRKILLVLLAFMGAITLVVISAAASVLAYRQFAGDERSSMDVVVEGMQLDQRQEGEPEGVFVIRVEPGSPAEAAGLSSGTLILSVNGRPVNSPQELKETIGEYEVGDTVTLTIQDGDGTRDVPVTLGDSGPYLGVNVGPAGGVYRFRGQGSGEAPHGFVLPEMPGMPGEPFGPEGQMPGPFGFHFDEYDFDQFGDHGRFFDLLGKSALVMSVEEGTPAAEAGLQPGDAIIEANGETIEDNQQLVDVITGLAPGDTLSLELQRGEEILTFEVTLSSHPKDEERAFLGVFLAPVMMHREGEFFQDQQNS